MSCVTCTIDECRCKSVRYYNNCDMKPILSENYQIVFYECGKIETITERLHYYSSSIKTKSIEHNIYIDLNQYRLLEILNRCSTNHEIIKNDKLFKIFIIAASEYTKSNNIYPLALRFFQSSKM